MFDTVKTLRELVEKKVALGAPNAKGWRPVRCQVCHDYQERAAFIFDDIYTGASCFNCGSKFRYKEGSGKLNGNARRILECYGITREELNEVTGSSFLLKKAETKEITLESMKPQVSLYTPEVKLPPNSYPLGSDFCDELQTPIIEYLLSRHIDPLRLNAHFSTDPKFLNRVIVPCMREGKIIFWQARTILPGVKPRYMSPSVVKDAVLWGYDNIFKNYDQPLFITEGIFDAESLDGIALLGSKLNEAKLEILNRSKRRKIVVVDRDDNGSALAEMALEHGWEITFTALGVGDVNKSVQTRGRLLTIWDLLKNATVPSTLRTTKGVAVQSKLELGMQMALAKMTGRK